MSEVFSEAHLHRRQPTFITSLVAIIRPMLGMNTIITPDAITIRSFNTRLLLERAFGHTLKVYLR